MIFAVHVAAAAELDRKDTRVADLAKEVHDKGWIVYGAVSSKGDWDLFLMRPDGSNVRNITNTPAFSEAAPRFSPDGTKLLYRQLAKDAIINHDQWGIQGKLIIADADGSHPVAAGKEGEFPWAIWSPDGKQITCLTPKGILIIDLASKKTLRTIPRKGMYEQIGWSSDGKWFCGVFNHFSEQWTVGRMNVETGEINPVNSFQNCTPDWFSNANRVIFSHRPRNQDGYGWTQLWMADGDGKKLQFIFGEDGRHIYGGALSPDNMYSLFTACPDDGGGSEEGGAPMRLMRLADAPTIRGESKSLRDIHSDTKDGPILDLPVGWEPHWTYTEVGGNQ